MKTIRTKSNMDNNMVTEKTWTEFQSTGLFLFINQILHVFGWAIVYEINDKEEITKVYPARVKYRGFAGVVVEKAYHDIAKFVKDNAEELYKEAEFDDKI